MPRKRKAVPGQYLRRFEERVERIPEAGCWLWLSGVGANPYGTFSMYGKAHKAHRAAWELFRGPIPSGLLVCHRCDVVGCVNPDHLFLGTNDDNMADMVRKGRQASGKRIASAKLTDDQVRAIRKDTRTRREISNQYGIHPQNVRYVKTRRHYKHVEDLSG